MAVRVSLTGPAAGWVDRTALRAAGVHVDPGRRPTVLIAVDATVPPAPAAVELVAAVSAATGRCAVALCPPGAAEPDAAVAAAWRAAAPDQVPVAGIGPGLAGELALIDAAPADPVSPTPAQLRRGLLARRLELERVRRAEAARRAEVARARRVPAAIAAALARVAPEPARLRSAEDLDAAARRAAVALGAELGAPAPACPPAPAPPRTGQPADAAVALLTLGAATGAGRLLVAPLAALGADPAVTGAAGLAAGAVLAGTAVAGTRARRAAALRTRWAGEQVLRLRTRWTADLAEAAAPPPPAWRAGQLAAALGAAGTGAA